MSRQHDETKESMRKLLLVFLLLGLAAAAFATFSRRPHMPPEDTLSYELLQPGRLEVETDSFDVEDPSRFVSDPDGPDGKSPRRMKVRLWYPRPNERGPWPLLIYSHGSLMDGRGVAYIAHVLASHGYVVAAPDFPLTSRGQGERATSRDVLKQPRDVTLLIDQLLVRSENEKDELHSTIDPEHIAALGYSLGAMNVHLLGFHPVWQEPRIKAVVSLAGPTEIFTRKFLTTRFISKSSVSFSTSSSPM